MQIVTSDTYYLSTKNKAVMRNLILGAGMLFMNCFSTALYAQGATGNAEATTMKAGANKKSVLWYDEPAPNGGSVNIVKSRGFPYDEDWERWSLPIGNGYMGASIFGRTDTERIQLTEKTLGNKGPYGSGGLTSFAEIYMDINHQVPADYRRTLSLDDAISTVTYSYDGVKYTREYYASYPDNVIVVKLKADKPGKVSFLLRPVLPYLHGYNEEKTGRTGRVHAQDDLITMTGEVQFFRLPYEAQIKVVPSGGSMKALNDADGDHGMIEISNADSVVLLITAGTSYKLDESVFTLKPEEKFKDNEHPHAAVSRRIANAAAKGEAALRAGHLKDYKELYGRVELSLANGMPDATTDKLLQDYKNGKTSPYLEELLFQYGRYLLISSSRKGSLPPNLQGAWNQYDYAPWSGGYWHNINVQMNYWPAFNTNLAELFEPYVDYNEAFRKKANQNAIAYIKKHNPSALSPVAEENGWTIGTGASAFNISGASTHSGPGTGAFTAKLFWDYYDFTRDEKILREHTYPTILGVAKFLSKTLKPSADGVLLVDPSASPEQRHNGVHYRTRGCTFDQSMVYENHNDVLKAARILKINDPFIRTIKNQIGKLDAIHIGESGQIKEYREEKKYSDIGDPHHRHISHLCALYPGTLINSNTPEWMKASTVTLNKRGDKSTGWAIAHRLNLWARTKDGNRAYKVYQQLLKSGILENLWDIHPPLQIDGNFGATAGVAEMLLQSHEGYIEPLPALPDAWADGSYKGLVARGNFVCSVEWRNKKITGMRIVARSGGECVLKCANAEVKGIFADGRKVKAKPAKGNIVSFNTKVGGVYDVRF